MIGDHHGQTVRRATLLVTAADEILGHHRGYRHPQRLLLEYNGAQHCSSATGETVPELPVRHA